MLGVQLLDPEKLGVVQQADAFVGESGSDQVDARAPARPWSNTGAF